MPLFKSFLTSLKGSEIIVAGLLLLLFLTTSFPVFAQEYTIRVTTVAGTPVEGASVYGNKGFQNLPGRVTASDGTFNFQQQELDAGSPPTVSVTHSTYAVIPSEIVVSPTQCPGRVCSFQLSTVGAATRIIELHFRGINYQPLANVPVAIGGAHSSCPKLSDQHGYSFFAVDARESCSLSNDGNPNNDFFRILPMNIEGLRCTFASSGQSGLRLCPGATNEQAVIQVLCGIAPAAPAGEPQYEFTVTDESGTKLSGIEFIVEPGGEQLATRVTNGEGKFSFRPSQLQLAADTTFRVFTTNQNFQVYPREITLPSASCPGNRCELKAARTDGLGSAIVKVKTILEGEPIPGVSISATGLGCGASSRRVTAEDGIATFSVFRRPGSCSNIDSQPQNDRTSFNPNLRGCSFQHSSTTPFQLCPLTVSETLIYTATCGDENNNTHILSGVVRDVGGQTLADASLLHNDMYPIQTRADGSYSVYIAAQDNHTIKVESEDMLFDPALIELRKPEENTEQNFSAVLNINPDDDERTESCPIQNVYEISGIALDRNGSRLPGVVISNRFEQVAITDENGAFSFLVERMSDNWVSAEYEDEFFNPYGYTLPQTVCSHTSMVFQITDEPAVLLSGRVTTRQGLPLPNTKVFIDDGESLWQTETNLLGTWMMPVEEESSYLLWAEYQGYEIAPASHEGLAEEDTSGLDFVATAEPLPVPSPTPTPPAPQPTATPVPSQTPLPTPSPSPPVPTPTVSPVPSPTPEPSPEIPDEPPVPSPEPTPPTPEPSPDDTPTPPTPPDPEEPPQGPTPAKLRLTSLCSDDPAAQRRWRVRNTNNVDIVSTWKLHGTDLQGDILVQAGSESYFHTPTIAGPNTLRLFVNDTQHDVKASGGVLCSLPEEPEIPGNNFSLQYLGRTYAYNSSTFSYKLCRTGHDPSASFTAFVLGVSECNPIQQVVTCTTGSTHQYCRSSFDAEAQFHGIRWQENNTVLRNLGDCKEYEVSFAGQILEASVPYYTKNSLCSGESCTSGNTTGPGCLASAPPPPTPPSPSPAPSPTVTPTPVLPPASPSPTATPLPTQPDTPLSPVTVSQLCKLETQHYRFQAHNQTANSIELHWHMLGTERNGLVQLDALSSVTFQVSQQQAFISPTILFNVSGEQIAALSANEELCDSGDDELPPAPPAPTPSPTVTPEPTATPRPTLSPPKPQPTQQPEPPSSPKPIPTVQPTISPEPIPTIRPEPTPQPSPEFEVELQVVGKNGRRAEDHPRTAKLLQKLGNELIVLIRNVNTREIVSKSSSDPERPGYFPITIRGVGKYRISLKSTHNRILTKSSPRSVLVVFNEENIDRGVVRLIMAVERNATAMRKRRSAMRKRSR